MEQKNSLKNLIIITFIVLLVLLVFYLMTITITKHLDTKTDDDNKTSDTIIDYENILVSNIYTQKPSSYYVLVMMPNDDKINDYKSSLADYSEKEGALSVFYIDLSSAFNKKYISESTDFSGKFPIFSETTILKIDSHEISEIYQGENISIFLETIK